jgi:hypothetical protein
MIKYITSASIIPGAACPLSRRTLSRAVIPSEARTASTPRVFCAENISYALSGGSSESSAVCKAAGCAEVLIGDFPGGVLGFARPQHPAPGVTLLELVFPATRYLRIFSSRFGPSPRIASKSSTLLKAPYDLRICNILSAVAGPIPGTCCSSSEVAVLRITGVAAGFFLPASADAAKIKPRKRKEERSRIGNRRAMAAI